MSTVTEIAHGGQVLVIAVIIIITTTTTVDLMIHRVKNLRRARSIKREKWPPTPDQIPPLSFACMSDNK